jgi:hypothetical protein
MQHIGLAKRVAAVNARAFDQAQFIAVAQLDIGHITGFAIATIGFHGENLLLSEGAEISDRKLYYHPYIGFFLSNFHKDTNIWEFKLLVFGFFDGISNGNCYGIQGLIGIGNRIGACRDTSYF